MWILSHLLLENKVLEYEDFCTLSKAKNLHKKITILIRFFQHSGFYINSKIRFCGVFL